MGIFGSRKKSKYELQREKERKEMVAKIEEKRLEEEQSVEEETGEENDTQSSSSHFLEIRFGTNSWAHVFGSLEECRQIKGNIINNGGFIELKDVETYEDDERVKITINTSQILSMLIFVNE